MKILSEKDDGECEDVDEEVDEEVDGECEDVDEGDQATTEPPCKSLDSQTWTNLSQFHPPAAYLFLFFACEKFKSGAFWSWMDDQVNQTQSWGSILIGESGEKYK